MKQLKLLRLSLTLLALLGMSACASFNPVPLDELSFKERAVTEDEGGLRVSVSVLTREEAQQAFGVNLQKRGIQPVWLEIENRTDKDFWLMLTGLDPNYFSAHEAAYMNHFQFGGKTNKEMDVYFSGLGFDQRVRPGKTSNGFTFTNETVGTKEVRVRLYSSKDVRTFEFFVSIPGIRSEWNADDFRSLIEEAGIDIESDEVLRKTLVTLPCCTQRADGTGAGDPLNLAIVGAAPALKAFIMSGWDETAFKEDIRSVFGAAYLYGRPPDIQFQKSRSKVDSVNLVRLWVSPFKFRGRLVLVGSVGRNIDPDVDEAAQYVVEDLATAGMIGRMGKVSGVGAVSRDNPRQNFAHAPYWTDGNRVVLESSEQPVGLDEIEFFRWAWSSRLRPASDE